MYMYMYMSMYMYLYVHMHVYVCYVCIYVHSWVYMHMCQSHPARPPPGTLRVRCEGQTSLGEVQAPRSSTAEKRPLRDPAP